MEGLGAWGGVVHVRMIHAVKEKAFAVGGGIRMNAAIHEWRGIAQKA
jgi:heptaprenylglyceryl phosphate synthase